MQVQKPLKLGIFGKYAIITIFVMAVDTTATKTRKSDPDQVNRSLN